MHLDGAAVKSCTVLAVQADGATVRTVEDLAPDLSTSTPSRPRSWSITGCSAASARRACSWPRSSSSSASPDPTDDEIRAAIHGNFCRCTGYQSIVSSVREARR